MKLAPYTNTTDKPQHVGNRTVNPGQTRMIEEDLLPKVEAKFDPDTFLARNVKAIESELFELPLPHLQQLIESERAGAKRKRLLDSISHEMLAQEKRAELDDFTRSLADQSADELSIFLLELKDDDEKRMIVEAELKTR